MAKVPNQGGGEVPATERETPVGMQAPVSPEVLAMVSAMQGSGAAPGEDVVPSISSGRDHTPYPQVEPTPPFLLVFDPNRWDVVAGRLIPVFYRLTYTPGANGVDRGTDGLPLPMQAIVAIEERGHKPIPFMAGAGGRSYLRRVQVGTAIVRKTGAVIPVYAHMTRWDTLWPGSSEQGCDTAGYAEWAEGLVESGLLPRPRAYVLEGIESRLVARLAHYRGKANGSHPLVARYEADLATVRAYKARMGRGAPAPAEAVVVPT